MITWAELAPQIIVAIAILAIALLLLRAILGMAKSLTKPGANGKRENRIEGIEGEMSKHSAILESHGRMHRKQFAAIGVLQRGQNEILEHLTGQPTSTPLIPSDIDAADTGQFFIPPIGD